MLIAIVPLLVAIVGLLLYVLATNQKLAQVGLVLFAAGTLVTLMTVASHTVRVGVFEVTAPGVPS